MVVWYNVDAPDAATFVPIKGDVIGIVRENGKTSVMVDESGTEVAYQLDEGLIEFGTALHDNDFGRVLLFLEELGERPQTEAMWENVANNAMSERYQNFVKIDFCHICIKLIQKYNINSTNHISKLFQFRALTVAARCYAALGDAACSRLLKEVVRMGEHYSEETGNEPLTSPDCWAMLAILKGELKTAEAVYLEQNELGKALEMYQRYWHWEDALTLAQQRRWAGLTQLR